MKTKAKMTDVRIYTNVKSLKDRRKKVDRVVVRYRNPEYEWIRAYEFPTAMVDWERIPNEIEVEI